MSLISHRRQYAGVLAILVPTLARTALAQVERGERFSMHGLASAVPLVTRATPTAGARSLSEGYLSQPLIMVGVQRASLRASLTLNFEGLTLSRGELTTGTHGEGYVDRRHPHAYLHEAMLGAERRIGALVGSVFVGRGFAPFGSDDPMVRPFQKFPGNHHLAQILERLVVVAAVRRADLSLEAGVFGGDEPTTPAAAPRFERFGDSWSARLTYRGLRAGDAPLELSASAADVTSPEVARGGGLNQAKRSLVARWHGSAPNRKHYLMAEWARSTSRTEFGRPAGAYGSLLAEAAVCRGGPTLGARVERTERPEEERLADLFRTSNPPIDDSILGVTRWLTTTISLSTPVPLGALRARPFVEIAAARPRERESGGAFDPGTFYGAGTLWMFSAGAKLSVGTGHDRMGRYGAGLPPAAAAGTNHAAMGHEMHPPAGGSANEAGVNRCAA